MTLSQPGPNWSSTLLKSPYLSDAPSTVHYITPTHHLTNVNCSQVIPFSKLRSKPHTHTEHSITVPSHILLCVHPEKSLFLQTLFTASKTCAPSAIMRLSSAYMKSLPASVSTLKYLSISCHSFLSFTLQKYTSTSYASIPSYFELLAVIPFMPDGVPHFKVHHPCNNVSLFISICS